MSEEPAIYEARPQTCKRCGRTIAPDPREAEALAELERAFPALKPEKRELLCEVCARESEQ